MLCEQDRVCALVGGCYVSVTQAHNVSVSPLLSSMQAAVLKSKHQTASFAGLLTQLYQ